MLKENIALITATSLFLTSCNLTSNVRASETASPSKTPTPESTPTFTPTLTPTRTPTRTPTPTHTPNFEATNVYRMETSLDGETLTLENAGINAFMVIHQITGGSYIYGLDTNMNGETERIFENFDCEYDIASDEGVLDTKISTGFNPLASIDKWRTRFEMDELVVTKAAEYGDIEVFTSLSFEYKGKNYECAEYSEKQRRYDQARPYIEKLIEVINNLK